MPFKEFTFVSSTNRKIIGNSFLCEGKAVGNIIIVHGMAEHSLRYQHFAEFLNSQNYNVYMLDHIGHGKNAYGGIGVWSRHGFDKCVKNVDLLIKKFDDEKIPTFLIAHSMGSFMAQAIMERYKYSNLKKVVLIGSSGPQPLYKVGAFIAKVHAFGKNGKKPSKFLNNITFSGYNKKIKDPKTPFDWLSANEENVEEYIKDPYCGFVPCINFFVSFTENLAILHKEDYLNRIDKNLKILLIAGEDDPVSNYGKTLHKLQSLYKALNLDSTLVLYPGLRHEVLNEKCRDSIYKDICDFLQD